MYAKQQGTTILSPPFLGEKTHSDNLTLLFCRERYICLNLDHVHFVCSPSVPSNSSITLQFSTKNKIKSTSPKTCILHTRSPNLNLFGAVLLHGHGCVCNICNEKQHRNSLRNTVPLQNLQSSP